jgi:hypothetical protein
MLKLEKRSQLSGLAIRLRERERFFEARFLQALAIALMLHCGALLLFHVTPFTFSSTFVFSPVQVQSDHPLPSLSVFATPDIDENEELHPPPPPRIPTLDWITLPYESTLSPSLTIDPHAFQFMEERLWPTWHSPLSLKLEEPPIQLIISGDLAELPLVASDPLLDDRQSISFHSSPSYVTYQVQLDEKTGEIFWYERMESSRVATLDHLTENILLNLRFSPSESKEPVAGTLNFIILNTEIK